MISGNVVKSIIHLRTGTAYCIQLCHHWSINFYIMWTLIQIICWVSLLTKSHNTQRDICASLNITTPMCFMKVLRCMQNTNITTAFLETMSPWYWQMRWILILFWSRKALTVCLLLRNICQIVRIVNVLRWSCTNSLTSITLFSIEPLWQHGHAHVDGALNSDNADDKPNALLSNPTPLDEPSSLDDGHTDDVPDFLYRLQMHRKTHPTNLLSGSLNINSIRNKFSTVEYIPQNAYVDIFGICETKLDDTFPEGQFHVKKLYILS